MANDVIQVNYDALERIQREFSRCAEESTRIHQRLKNGAGRLVGSKWEGEAARKFFNEMDEDVLPAFDRLSKALTGCEEVTASLIQEFRQAEEEAAALFRKDGDSGGTPGSGSGDPGTGNGGSTGTGGSTGPGGGGGGGSWGELDKEDYDWLSWQNKTTGKTASFITGALKNILGEAGKTTGLSYFLEGFSIGVNIATDDDLSTDALKAIVGEVGKYLLKKGIVKLIPVAGTIFLVSDGLQLLAYLAAGAAASSGNPELANKIRAVADFANLSGHLEDLVEKGYDLVKDGINSAGEWLSNQANDLLTSLQLSPQGALAY
jgi:WXG100 family type VII secretion target